MQSGWRGWKWGLCLSVMALLEAQAATQDCPAIVSPLKRLECFDLAAGTPILLFKIKHGDEATYQTAPDAPALK